MDRRRPPAQHHPGAIPLEELEALDSEVHHLAVRTAEDRIEGRTRFETLERQVRELDRTMAVQAKILERVAEEQTDLRRYARTTLTTLVVSILVAVAGALMALLQRR